MTAHGLEEHVVERGDAGIHGRLAELMDRYELPLYRFLFVLVTDRDVAQDCTQDTFVRAYENLKRGKPVTPQWLYTVARNRAMDEFRRRRREQPDIEKLEQVPVEGIADGAAMRQAFAHLSADDRALLYLVAVEGFKPGEIASLLGIKVTAVRTRIFRARERFRLAYGERP